MLQSLKFFYDFFNPKQERSDMLNLILPAVANMLKGMVLDKAQSLASEHLEKHFEELPKEVKEALDGAVNDDGTHAHKSLMDLVKG
jgi:histone H3/H4|tara:strand:- start:783 stop:1040 length:258 start_codon:yes stop_codon:yes gene_type:complete